MKLVYYFGDGQADGAVHQKDILGGKGANLAEMTRLGIPVPPGFTITAGVCTYYMNNKKFPLKLENQVLQSLKKIEAAMNQKFDSHSNPLLVSVRSGARQSMPGMMETVLNVGLTNETIPGLIKQSNDERFVYDAYRRLITMYADVVMEKAQNLVAVPYTSKWSDLGGWDAIWKECKPDSLGNVISKTDRSGLEMHCL